ncbi:MAG: branched-chain-amino-acid transaminase [Planctomycetaceae bacterium]
MSQVFINGSLVPKEAATVSVYDHGLLYGDGVFEGIRVYAGKVFLLEDHIERLFESAAAIRLDIERDAGMSRTAMAAAVNETVSANEIQDGYVRLVITRGAGYLGLDPQRTSNPQTIIIADNIELYPQEIYDNGMHLVTATTIRNHPGALSPRIKSLNYLNNILAKIEGVDAGSPEALMLNHKGEVAECTGDNIFIVRNGEIRTPSTDAGILEGITRNTVICLAKKAGFPMTECGLVRHDIYVADECFLTGSAAEIVPVVSLDGRTVGNGRPGPVTRELWDLFQQLKGH